MIRYFLENEVSSTSDGFFSISKIFLLVLLLARAALTDERTIYVQLCVQLCTLLVWMGILCLATGCYVNCLNPTSRVPLLGDTKTERSSNTSGEQELGQSARTWIMHGKPRTRRYLKPGPRAHSRRTWGA